MLAQVTLVHGFDEAITWDHMRLMNTWWRCIDDQARDLLNLEFMWRSWSLFVLNS